MNEVEKAVNAAKMQQSYMLAAIVDGRYSAAQVMRRLRDSNMATARFEKNRAARNSVRYSEVVEALKQADFIIHMMMPGITNVGSIDFKKLNEGTILIGDTLRRIKDASAK